MLHHRRHRRHRRQRPIRRAGVRCRDAVVPVAHVLRAERIDQVVAERGQYPAPHGMRVVLPRRRLPAFGAVGEERRRERPHRRNRRRCAVRLGISEHRPHRVPCILDCQRVERSDRPLHDRAAAPPMHNPHLAPVRAHPQSETRRRAVPQHSLASFRSGEGASARRGDLRFVRHLPIPPVRFGRDRRVAGAPWLGNTRDTPDNGAGFGDRKGRKRRARTPRGLQAVVSRGLSALRGCAEEVRFSTPFGVLFSHPTQRRRERPPR